MNQQKKKKKIRVRFLFYESNEMMIISSFSSIHGSRITARTAFSLGFFNLFSILIHEITNGHVSRDGIGKYLYIYRRDNGVWRCEKQEREKKHGFPFLPPIWECFICIGVCPYRFGFAIESYIDHGDGLFSPRSFDRIGLTFDGFFFVGLCIGIILRIALFRIVAGTGGSDGGRCFGGAHGWMRFAFFHGIGPCTRILVQFFRPVFYFFGRIGQYLDGIQLNAHAKIPAIFHLGNSQCNVSFQDCQRLQHRIRSIECGRNGHFALGVAVVVIGSKQLRDGRYGGMGKMLSKRRLQCFQYHRRFGNQIMSSRFRCGLIILDKKQSTNMARF